MMKQYLDLERQIVHLAIDKSIMFEHTDIEVAKNLLRDHNYRNFVSCSKIKYAELISPKLIMYKTASFKEWRAYFDMDCRLSQHLIGNLIQFERTINSRLSYQISELMEKDQFSNFEKNMIIQLVQSWQRRRFGLKSEQKLKEPYEGNRIWELLPQMTFGEMKQLLFWFLENKQAIYLEIVAGYDFLGKPKTAKDRIDEINRLRNNLVHFRPLNVYITHGNQKRKLNNKYRKETVKFVLGLNRNRRRQLELKEILNNSDNYVKIKNNQHYVG